MKKLIHLTIPMLVLLAGLNPAAAQGTKFTYQGHLNDNGGSGTGSYDFRFRLASDALGNNFVAGPLLSNAVPVSGGLFTVALDFGPVFNGSNFWLQVDVKTNGAGGYTTLSPLQPLTPTPYAIMANTTSNLLGTLPASQLTGTVGNSQLADNAVNSAKIADLSIVTADLADNSVTSPKIVDGAIATADLANDAVNSAKVLDGSLVGADLANNTVTAVQLADAIELGASGVNGRLDVFQNASGTAAITLLGSSSQISTYGSDGLEQSRLYGPSWGELWLNNSAVGNQRAVLLSANGAAGGFLSLNNSNGAVRARLDGLNNGGALTLYQADGGIGAFIDGESGGAGYLDLRSTNGSSRVVLDADAGDGGGLVQVRNAIGATKITLDGQSASSAGEISLFDANGRETMQILGAENSTEGAELRLRNASGQDTIELDADCGGCGSGGFMRLLKTNGSPSMYLYADYNGTGGGRIGIGRMPVVNALEVAGNASKDVAGTWLANSDRRIKEDVRPLKHALETLNRVRPVGFRYTDEYLAQHPTIRNVEYYNVIAQEFAEVFPESVQKGGDKLANGDSVLQVDTYPATIYSIAAIQELDRKLKARDARVAELEQDVAELKSLLQTMLQKTTRGGQ